MSEPLSTNERRLALTAWETGADALRWGNLVLEAYDFVGAELAAAREEAETLREALRKAYPYVMDALEFSETPALAAIVREDLEQFIVPALAAQEAVA